MVYGAEGQSTIPYGEKERAAYALKGFDLAPLRATELIHKRGILHIESARKSRGSGSRGSNIVCLGGGIGIAGKSCLRARCPCLNQFAKHSLERVASRS